MLSADHGLLQCESRRDGKLRLVMGDWAAADVSEQEGPGSARYNERLELQEQETAMFVVMAFSNFSGSNGQ